MVEDKIAQAIAQADTTCTNIEVEFDGVTYEVDYSLEEQGYQEDNYFNGTGAWITTSITLYINEILTYNNQGEDIDINKVFDVAYIESKVAKMLIN